MQPLLYRLFQWNMVPAQIMIIRFFSSPAAMRVKIGDQEDAIFRLTTADYGCPKFCFVAKIRHKMGVF